MHEPMRCHLILDISAGFLGSIAQVGVVMETVGFLTLHVFLPFDGPDYARWNGFALLYDKK